MARSWVYGATVVAGVHALWFGLIFLESRADWFMAAIITMLFITMNVAGLGAFITAYHAPRHRLPLALSMAPLAAAFATVGNVLLAASGTHVNFAGVRGHLGLFVVSLAYGIFVSTVGGGIGAWRAGRRPADAAPPVTELPAPQSAPPGPESVTNNSAA